jgi:hypothetical protein
MAQHRPECKDVCASLGVPQVVERGLLSSDNLNALNALELACMLPIGAVSTHVICIMLDEVIDSWNALLRTEKVIYIV